MSGVTVSSGASIASYKFVGGGYSWSSATDTSYMTGFLMNSGTNTFTVTVTDTRGYSTSKSVSIVVQPYESPKVTTMTTYRSNGAEEVENGSYIVFILATSFSAVGGLNTLNLRVNYRRLGTETWSVTYTIPNDGAWRIPADLEPTDEMPYQILVTLYDSITTITQIYDVAGAKYTMHFAAGGRNVSIGMAGNRIDALEVNPAWRIYHGNTDITAKLSGVTTIASGGTGATTAVGAMANLGAAAAAHNHAAANITSGILPVARGGTGAGALTANRALITDGSGNVAVSAITSTQLGYLSGVTGNIQSQINALASGGNTPRIVYGSTFINGNTAAIIYYSGFSYVPYIVVTYSSTGANWAGDNGAIKVYNKTTSYAYIIVGGTFATNRQVDWIAIGI